MFSFSTEFFKKAAPEANRFFERLFRSISVMAFHSNGRKFSSSFFFFWSLFDHGEYAYRALCKNSDQNSQK